MSCVLFEKKKSRGRVHIQPYRLSRRYHKRVRDAGDQQGRVRRPVGMDRYSGTTLETVNVHLHAYLEDYLSMPAINNIVFSGVIYTGCTDRMRYSRFGFCPRYPSRRLRRIVRVQYAMSTDPHPAGKSQTHKHTNASAPTHTHTHSAG